MRKNTLLAGVAALALLAGTGLVFAQSPEHHKAGTAATTGAATKPMNPGKGGPGAAMKPQSKMAQGTQAQGTGPKPTGPNVKGPKATGTMATGKAAALQGPSGNPSNAGTMQHHNRTAQRYQPRGPNAGTTAQQMEHNGSLKGLQGNAAMPMKGGGAGGNVQLSDQQRTTIRDSVIDASGAPRVGHVDFNVSIGTVIPRREIHVVPVPETLVRIEPRWRGFLYFVYEDEVVIVNPRTMRIVAVVTV
jgi:uncharacterized membrane protein